MTFRAGVLLSRGQRRTRMIDRRAQRMEHIEQAIELRKARIARDWRRIGKFLVEVKQKSLWLVGGWDGFEQWLGHMDISQSWAYDIMAIVDSPHADIMATMNVSTARLVLPHMRNATRAQAQALADEVLAHPRLSDRRAALNGEREHPPVPVECPNCHARLLANRAVILQNGGRAHGRQGQAQAPSQHHG